MSIKVIQIMQKECYGVEAFPLLHFQNPGISFPIAAIQTQLGLSEKLIVKLAGKILDPLDFRNLIQLE